MIVIQDFQDPYTLNVKQLMKCCVEEITPDGRLIPFCAYNSVGYREQVRAQLSGTAVDDGRAKRRSSWPTCSCPPVTARAPWRPASRGPIPPVQVNLGRSAAVSRAAIARRRSVS